MKKVLSAAMAVSVVAALAVSASALYADRQDVTVYRNTPTLDGVINNGEWDIENAIDMTADNCEPWSGEISNAVYFYYSWDDTGLYLAADVADDDVILADDPIAVYGKDAFQIALDPHGLLGDDGQGGGMFFSIGPMVDGSLGAVYHPYGGAAQEFEYTGAYSMTDSGWQFEMVIPWTSIEILADDGYAWTHADGEFINAIICMLDRDDDCNIQNHYKTAIEDRVTFAPADYALKLNLSTYVAPSLEEPEEPAADEPTDAPADDAPVAPTTADAGIVASAVVMAAAAGVVLSKKH